jgi:hypothetical protein
MAGDKLFLMGPPDIVDEEVSFEKLKEGDPEVQKLLAKQDAALNGAQGTILLVVNPEDGKITARHNLSSLPSWDSLASARGKLFYTTEDGRVVCLGGK